MTMNTENQFPATGEDQQNYIAGLRALADARLANTDVLFLKFSKLGEWTYGAEDVPIGVTDRLIVDPDSFMLGVIGWKNGQVVDEIMHKLGRGTVDKTELPEIVSKKSDDGWKDQLGLLLRLPDVDVPPLSFKTTSRGGLGCLQTLAEAMVKHGGDDWPVVRLTMSSYPHRNYGKIITPVIEIIEWQAPKGSEPKREQRPLV